MNAGCISDPQDRSQIVAFLQLIQNQEKRYLSPFPDRCNQLIQIGIFMCSQLGNDALMGMRFRHLIKNLPVNFKDRYASRFYLIHQSSQDGIRFAFTFLNPQFVYRTASAHGLKNRITPFQTIQRARFCRLAFCLERSFLSDGTLCLERRFLSDRTLCWPVLTSFIRRTGHLRWLLFLLSFRSHLLSPPESSSSADPAADPHFLDLNTRSALQDRLPLNNLPVPHV